MSHVVFVDSTGPALAALETARDMGHSVTFVFPSKNSLLTVAGVPRERLDAAFAYADEVVEIGDLESELVGALRKIQARQPIDALLTTSEPAVLPTVAAAEALGIRATSVTSMLTAVNKDVCRDALRDAGIPSARHARVATLQEAVDALHAFGLPLVVKPSRSAGKEGVAIIRSEAELAEYFEALPTAKQERHQALDTWISSQLVVEEFVQGVLYSAEIIANGGDLEIFMFARREQATHNPLVEVAAVLPAGLTDAEQQAVDAYMRAVFAELGLTVGVYHVEFIMGPDGPVLVEVNGRMMGGMAPFVYRHITGDDVFRLLVSEHLGERPRIVRPPFGAAGISIALGSITGGTLPAGVERRIEELKSAYQPLAHSLNLRGGQHIPRQLGNYTVFGFCCLAAATPEEARSRGLELLADLEDAFEFELAKYAL
ncbi:ATP-grasp domain-containing protein [Streptacidiphilus jiangxiensis]|uniref:Biotin carboxylase n=1 Tax=Streptacidiphilus jiangxiensis TaxID=235985 RepID=A0A1H7XM64_STRJI|nr:ATP-grasp domain-containing protein [Streptacidiphilus jiangxiensis]SEM34733.1 Biotin carboxylase [Streptacidiphilus jiangxiensis]